MAKDYQDIDRIFQDKLRDHSVQPTPLAREKLESRLNRREKGGLAWMRIAASLLLVGGLAALLWLSVENTKEELNHPLAQQKPAQQYAAPESPVLPEAAPVEAEEAPESERTSKPLASLPTVQKTAPAPTSADPIPTEDSRPDPIVKETIPVLELESIALPPLNQDLLLADNNLAESVSEPGQDVTYKVTIISNGLREKPEKEGLVGEIENKIDKIGGLIVKVDQGFADLQDAKNNLFASITTRK